MWKEWVIAEIVSHIGVFALMIISNNAILLVIIISTRVAPLGSSRVSNEAKNFRELEFLGLSHCFSSHNWINFQKPSQKWHFLTYFGRFWRLFNSDWKVAAETKKNEFLDDFRFIWHPTWPQECDSNGLKWFEGYLIQCALEPSKNGISAL